MKQLFSVLWQTVVLYLTAFAGFVVGMTMPSLRVSHVVSQTSTRIREYDFNWLIAVLLMYAVLLLVGVLRQRIRTSWMATTLALVFAIAVVLLFTQLGIKDTAVPAA